MNNYDKDGNKIKNEIENDNDNDEFQSFDKFLKNPVRKIDEFQINNYSETLLPEKDDDVMSQKEEID